MDVDWTLIGRGLDPDWTQIGRGLDVDRTRVGCDYTRIKRGFAADWMWIGRRLDTVGTWIGLTMPDFCYRLSFPRNPENTPEILCWDFPGILQEICELESDWTRIGP